MKKILMMPTEVWNMLAPILEQYVVEPEEVIKDETPIDWDKLKSMPTGVRLVNVLQDGQWSSKYTQSGEDGMGRPYYTVETIGQLKSITSIEFLKHRNAGRKAWATLREYISNL